MAGWARREGGPSVNVFIPGIVGSTTHAVAGDGGTWVPMASADGRMPISAGGHFVPLAPAAGVKRPLPDRAGTGALVRVGRAQPRDRRLGEAEPPAPCCWQGLSAHGWGSRAQAWSHDPPTHPGAVLHPKFAGGYRTLRGRQDRAWGDPPPDTGRLSPDPRPGPLHTEAPPWGCTAQSRGSEMSASLPSRCGRVCHGAGPVCPQLPQHSWVLQVCVPHRLRAGS